LARRPSISQSLTPRHMGSAHHLSMAHHQDSKEDNGLSVADNPPLSRIPRLSSSVLTRASTAHDTYPSGGLKHVSSDPMPFGFGMMRRQMGSCMHARKDASPRQKPDIKRPSYHRLPSTVAAASPPPHQSSRSTLTSMGHTGSHHLLPTNPQGSTRPSIRSRRSDPLPPVAVPRESQSKLSHVPLRQLLQSESSSSIIDASPVYRLKGVDGRARRASLSEHAHQELCERLSKDGILASR